jgi:hypothetical protein
MTEERRHRPPRRSEDYDRRCCDEIIEISAKVEALEEKMSREVTDREKADTEMATISDKVHVSKMSRGQLIFTLFSTLTMAAGAFGFFAIHIQENAKVENRVTLADSAIANVRVEVADLKSRTENLKLVPRMSVVMDTLLVAIRNANSKHGK